MSSAPASMDNIPTISSSDILNMVEAEPTYVCLLPRSYFRSKDELLVKLLSSSVRPKDLLTASTSTVYQLLTLILCCIEDQHHPISSTNEFISLARSVRDRCSVNRILKFRLLTMLGHAGFPLWTLQTTLRRNCYSVSHSHLRSQLFKDSEIIENKYNTSKAFCEFISQIIFAPCKASQFSNSHGKFTKQGLLQAIIQTPGIQNMEHARIIVSKLTQLHIVNPLVGNDDDDDDDDGNDQGDTCVMSSNITSMIRDADRVEYKKKKRKHRKRSSGPSNSGSNISTNSPSNSCTNSGGNSLSTFVSKLDNDEIATSIALVMPVDMIDFGSIEFWCNTVFEKKFEKDLSFGIHSVIHPLLICTPGRDGHKSVKHEDCKSFTDKKENTDDDNDDNDMLIEKVTVTQVFSSLSRPCLVSLQKLKEGGNPNKDSEAIKPTLLLKIGDNLMQDHCVSIMFQVFNHIWRHSEVYKDETSIPHCYSYEVIPTSPADGFIEGISNIESLSDIDWNEWYAKHCRDPTSRTITNFLLSAAGAFVGGYVLGATDRHWGNMVLKDETTLLHIDFSFILGDAPPIDAPRISVPPAMEKLFKGIKTGNNTNGNSSSGCTLWDAFSEAVVTAFLALRKEHALVLKAATLLFTHAGFESSTVTSFLTGKSGLAIEKPEKDAGDYLRKKVKSSSSHWKTNLKRFVHDVVNPAWYAVVQNGPVPADGIMKLINRYQSKSSTTQKLTQQQQSKNNDDPNPDSSISIDW